MHSTEGLLVCECNQESVVDVSEITQALAYHVLYACYMIRQQLLPSWKKLDKLKQN